jgi:hypothetical protein
MVDFDFGTWLVLLDARKMKKLSYKDLIVALGVLVAAFIILTSIYFHDTDAKKAVKVSPEKKIKPAAIINHVLQKFTSHTSSI